MGFGISYGSVGTYLKCMEKDEQKRKDLFIQIQTMEFSAAKVLNK